MFITFRPSRDATGFFDTNYNNHLKSNCGCSTTYALGKLTNIPGISDSRAVWSDSYLIALNIYISSIHMSKLKKTWPLSQNECVVFAKK